MKSPAGKTVIGMLHLPPLPGSPMYGGSRETIRSTLLRDADLLTRGGVHALMMENFGDTPFYPGRVPAYVVAEMAALAAAVKATSDLPLGINVLRNDGQSALAVAAAAGAEFIRVNVLCGARVTDQGVIQGIAHDLLRERAILNATGIRIFADVDVKHSVALAPRELKHEIDDTVERAGADALIVSGAGTGKPTDPAKVELVKRHAGGKPVYLGSGVTADTLAELAKYADGFIVGTAFKQGGVPTNPVELDRVVTLMRKLSQHEWHEGAKKKKVNHR